MRVQYPRTGPGARVNAPAMRVTISVDAERDGDDMHRRLDALTGSSSIRRPRSYPGELVVRLPREAAPIAVRDAVLGARMAVDVRLEREARARLSAEVEREVRRAAWAAIAADPRRSGEERAIAAEEARS